VNILNEQVNEQLTKTLFEVRETPVPFVNELISMGNGDMAKPSIDYNIETGFKMLIRNDTNEVISVVTNRYKLVRNYELLKVIDNHITEQKATLTSALIFGNARTSYVITFDELTQEINGENVSPRIMIQNSYDRTDSVKIIGGLFILVCTNGAIIGNVTNNVSYTHIIGREISAIEEKIDNVISDVLEFSTNTFPRLTDRKVLPDDIINFMGLFPQIGKDNILNKFKTNKPNTFYDLMQTGTYVLTHKMNRQAEATHRLEEGFISNLLGLM